MTKLFVSSVEVVNQGVVEKRVANFSEDPDDFTVDLIGTVLQGLRITFPNDRERRIKELQFIINDLQQHIAEDAEPCTATSPT